MSGNVSGVGDLLGAGGVDPAEIARIARLKVHLVSVDSLGIDREVYRGMPFAWVRLRSLWWANGLLTEEGSTEARSEKEARATEYSSIKRFLSKDDIVISDSLNYIKGLYISSQLTPSPSG